jgi:hypothetical protein
MLSTQPVCRRTIVVLCALAMAVSQAWGQAPPTWSISGTITSGSLATVNLSGTTSGSTVADAGGNYILTELVDGTYTVSPYEPGSSFTPPSQVVTVNGASVVGVSFTAQLRSSVIYVDSQETTCGNGVGGNGGQCY